MDSGKFYDMELAHRMEGMPLTLGQMREYHEGAPISQEQFKAHLRTARMVNRLRKAQDKPVREFRPLPPLKD